MDTKYEPDEKSKKLRDVAMELENNEFADAATTALEACLILLKEHGATSMGAMEVLMLAAGTWPGWEEDEEKEAPGIH